MSDISIRNGRKSDAADIALLDNIAGHGISLWFWQSEAPGDRLEDALAYGRQRMADDDAPFGWRNSRIAEKEDQILGFTSSYVMEASVDDFRPNEVGKAALQPFAPVFELYLRANGDWFLDALAVYPEARGKGVGTKLLDDSIELGRSSNSSCISLVMEDSNVAAMSLYKQRGFEVVDRRKYINFESGTDSQQWLHMRREL